MTIDEMAHLLAIGEFIADRALQIRNLGPGNRAYVGWLDALAQVSKVDVRERCWNEKRHATRCAECRAASQVLEPESEGALHCKKQQGWWEAEDLVKAVLYLGLLMPLICRDGQLVAMASNHPTTENGALSPRVPLGLFEVIDDGGPMVELIGEHKLYFDQGQLKRLARSLKKSRGPVGMAARQAVQAGHDTPACARDWLVANKGWRTGLSEGWRRCPDLGKRVQVTTPVLYDRLGAMHEETALQEAVAEARRRKARTTERSGGKT